LSGFRKPLRRGAHLRSPLRRNRVAAGRGALMKLVQSLLIIAASLVWLSGCETSTKLSDLFHSNSASSTDPEVTGTVPGAPGQPQSLDPGLLGSDPKDDLSLAKQYYRQENFGLAEHYFRRAVETHPRDAEAWLGLAAAYDRLHRFDLADRAYAQAIALVGPLPEILNNQGFSYMMRGDYARARKKLTAAQAAEPSNPYIINNLKLLAKSERKAKAIQ
jgi:tetratricopeptide (TPR) repeat protein